MFASLFVTVALALFGCVSAAPQKRALAQVYSKCTVPNTVALTFVRMVALMIDNLFKPSPSRIG